jgi:acylphosphatase
LYTVKGRVQGVWFRDSTRREAERLGLAGFANNLADGDVQVLAIGDTEALRQLAAWLRDGPPMAQVSDLSWEEVEVEQRTGFTIG